jgi:hypothetical protein
MENLEDSTPKKPDEENYESDSSADSSDEEKCPICLLSFASDQEIGKPAVCEHSFCFPCIREWSSVVQTCPIDRKEFNEIRVYGNLESTEVLRTVAIKEKVKLDELLASDEFTACEICENTDREDCMLLCDGCDKGGWKVEMNFAMLINWNFVSRFPYGLSRSTAAGGSSRKLVLRRMLQHQRRV